MPVRTSRAKLQRKRWSIFFRGAPRCPQEGYRVTALARPAYQVIREGKSQSQSKSEKVEGARPKASFELWQSQKKAWASELELSTESVRVVVRYAERGNGTVGTKRLKRREAKAAAMRCPIRSPRSVLVRWG